MEKIKLSSSFKKWIFISFIYSFLLTGFIFHTLYKFGDIGLFLSLVFTFLLVLSVGFLQFGISYLLEKIYSFDLLMLPFCWSLTEYLREYFPFDGFPWFPVGTLLVNVPFYNLLISFFGVYGASFIVLWTAVSIFYGFKKNFISLILLVIFFIFLTPFIYLYKNSAESFYKKQNFIKVAIIQPDIKEEIKLNDKEFYKKSFEVLPLINDAINKKANLIILPETALGFIYSDYKNPLRKAIFYYSNFSPILIGLDNIKFKQKDGSLMKILPSNSVYLIYKEELLDHYDKVKLLPFGEYVPFPFHFLKKYFSAINGIDFIPGKKESPIKGNIDGKNIKIATPICFESDFADFTRKLSKGASIIVNPTNDGWFSFPEPLLNEEQAKARAIENGLYLIRANNSGISSIISPFGKETAYLGFHKKGILYGYVPLKGYKTLFSKFGEAPFFILLFLSNIYFFIDKAFKT